MTQTAAVSPGAAGYCKASSLPGEAISPGATLAEESADGKRAAASAASARKVAEEEEDAEHEIASEDVARPHEVWDTLGGERAAELLAEARRKGETALNTSRLNIVGEGRAGKTAWLLGLSNQRFHETDSTIGVQQVEC